MEEIRSSDDMTLALFYMRHIGNPCSSQYGNNRPFWINLAEKTALPFMTNPAAKSLLEDTIKQYKLQ